MPFKTTDGSHIGVAKLSTSFSLSTYHYVQCSTSSGSKCYAELTNSGPSGSTMLAANIQDLVDSKTYASLHLFDSSGSFLWNYMIELGALPSSFYTPKSMKYVTSSAMIALQDSASVPILLAIINFSGTSEPTSHDTFEVGNADVY